MLASLIFQIVLLPVHLTLIWLFLSLQKSQGRTTLIDGATVVTALAAWLITAIWMHRVADTSSSAIWPYVLATTASFLVFSAVLALGWGLSKLARTR